MPARGTVLYPPCRQCHHQIRRSTDWRSRNDLRLDWDPQSTFVHLPARRPVHGIILSTRAPAYCPLSSVCAARLSTARTARTKLLPPGCDRPRFMVSLPPRPASHRILVNRPSRQPSAACADQPFIQSFSQMPVGMNQCWRWSDGIGLDTFQNASFHLPRSVL